MNSTLYSLAREYAALFDAATDPESDSASFDAALVDLSEEIREKASGVAAVIRSVKEMVLANQCREHSNNVGILPREKQMSDSKIEWTEQTR